MIFEACEVGGASSDLLCSALLTAPVVVAELVFPLTVSTSLSFLGELDVSDIDLNESDFGSPLDNSTYVRL